MKNSSKLVNGKIPKNTTCPFLKDCLSPTCPHKGVNHSIEFSCGYARAFDLLHRYGLEER